MKAFFQHVGEQNSARDFPRTLVSDAGDLIRFRFSQIERLLPLTPAQRGALAAQCMQEAPDGFQIWGVPEGAKSVLRDVAEGDAFLLLRTWGEEGRFGYAGKVIAIPRCLATDASKYLWGEGRFPLLLFMVGGQSALTWRDFRNGLGYAANWDPRGQTYPVKADRLAASPYRSAVGLLEAALIAEVHQEPTANDGSEWDAVPPTPEGRKKLRAHYQRERDPGLVRKFKQRLSRFACSICDFDFSEAYGLLGEGYIEAHHTVPIGGMRDGDETEIGSLAAVCANCHRMIHRRWPPHSIDDVREALLSVRSEEK